MSKLNIIEAMKMPIGTTFEVSFEDRFAFAKTEILYIALMGCKNFYYKENNQSVDMLNERYITATFITIQQPVSFMEVVNSDKKCKVEHQLIKDKMLSFNTFSDVLEALSVYHSSIQLRQIIKEGKWYIKESEADSNDIR
ncbi:MAG: hypothetical protein K0R54_2093 [Clostridiaceae bacterium]|jgi:hypothetical protein|nr:hypothetical protein [Clostridiaceae bacterium]